MSSVLNYHKNSLLASSIPHSCRHANATRIRLSFKNEIGSGFYFFRPDVDSSFPPLKVPMDDAAFFFLRWDCLRSIDSMWHDAGPNGFTAGRASRDQAGGNCFAISTWQVIRRSSCSRLRIGMLAPAQLSFFPAVIFVWAFFFWPLPAPADEKESGTGRKVANVGGSSVTLWILSTVVA